MLALSSSYKGSYARSVSKVDTRCRARQFHLAFLAALIIALACAFTHVPPAEAAPELTGTTKVDLVAGNETASDVDAVQVRSAVTGAPTPRKKADAGIRWAVTVDNGYVSPPVIVGDEVVVISGSKGKGVISKLDKGTGKTIATAEMKGSSTFALIPPTYADGTLFVTLAGGAMQAFDASTLEPLWHYQNELGGQGNCPVVYSDGFVYTGYWSGETAECSFVCLDAKTGKLVWEKKNAGGYYWVGALVVGDYLLFGCDDGELASTTGSSKVRCVDKRTGREISSVKVKGDQRSGIAYDPELGCIYFTCKTGCLYSAQFDAGTGRLSNPKFLEIDVESSATPAVYGGRVYVGGSSGGFSKGTLSVVDASTLKMLYQLDGTSGVDGTVKSTPLISTAYVGSSASGSQADLTTSGSGSVASDGNLYLYFTVNNPPGGIKMLAVAPNSNTASQAKVTELFTPPAELQQYCISNVICDEEGYLYYRNDSNYLMCIGPGGTDPAKYKVSAKEAKKGGSGYSMGPKSGAGTNKGKKNGADDGSSGKDKASKDKASKDKASKDESPSQGAQESDESSNGSTLRNRYLQESGNSPASNAGTAQSGGTGGTSGTSNGTSGSSSKANATSPAAAENSGGKAEGATTANTAGGADAGTRHTDAEAATTYLDGETDNPAPAWLVPAIVGGVAAIAMLGLALARAIAGRRRVHADGESGGAEADAADV